MLAATEDVAATLDEANGVCPCLYVVFSRLGWQLRCLETTSRETKEVLLVI